MKQRENPNAHTVLIIKGKIDRLSKPRTWQIFHTKKQEHNLKTTKGGTRTSRHHNGKHEYIQ